MSTVKDGAKGWGKSPASRKWHYFGTDGFSLCGKIGFFFGEVEEANDDHPQNCAACMKKKRALDKAQATKTN